MLLKQSLTERRALLGRLTLELANKRTALTAQERTRMRALRVEMDELETDIALNADRKYDVAFRNWLRAGWAGLPAEEQRLLVDRRDVRQLGTGGQSAYPDATAGFFVPTEFNDRVTSATKDVGPMLVLSTIRDTPSGAPRGFPVDNDTSASGEQVAENAAPTEQDIASLSQVTLKSYKYTSKFVLVSTELARDTGFDLEGYLVERFGVRLGRVTNTMFTTGLGTTQPLGVLTQATVVGTAAGAGTNDGTSGPNTLGTDDFAALEAAVDPAYRRNANWMMHANTLAALRKVKDKQGLPAFPGLHCGGQDTIFNYPIALNPNLGQLQGAPSSPPVASRTLMFGDFSKYVIRRAPPTLVRLHERFAEFGQLAFIMYWRMDGALIDGGGGAVKTMTNVY